MPRRTFTNADLAPRRGISPISGQPYNVPEELVEDITPAVPEYQPESPSYEDVMGPARETLRSLAAIPNGDWANGMEERAAGLSEGRRPDLRSLTEFVAAPAPYTAGASMIPGLGPVMGATTAALSAPDILRRLISPEEDESRGWAAAEGAAYAAAPLLVKGVGAGVRGAKRAIGGAASSVDDFMTNRVYEATQAAERAPAEAARDTIGMMRKATAGGRSRAQAQQSMGYQGSTEIPYASQQTAVPVNQVVQTAREIAAETGQPIDQVLKGYARSGGLEPGRLEALRKLARGGPAPSADIPYHPGFEPAGNLMDEYVQADKGLFSKIMRQVNAEVDPPFIRMAREDVMPDRITPTAIRRAVGR